MKDYSATEINNPLDDLFVSVNDIYEQYDEGRINYPESVAILKRVCNHFLAPQPDKNQDLNHSIQFDDVDSMVLWLLENNVDDTPITLTIHLGAKK
jgi:hypothetical protein